MKKKQLEELVREQLTLLTLEQDNPCWKGYTQIGMKDKDGKQVPNCVPETNETFIRHSIEADLSLLQESKREHRGKKVTLNKPSSGDVKKYKVFVTHPETGNVVKVNFGDPNMRIRRDNPEAKKSFRARHKCDEKNFKNDRHTAGYWSCRLWSTEKVSDIVG